MTARRAKSERRRKRQMRNTVRTNDDVVAIGFDLRDLERDLPFVQAEAVREGMI